MLKPTPTTPTTPHTPKRGKGRPKSAAAKKKLRLTRYEQKIIDIDRLPASAILRDWAVAQLLSCSRSTVWRYAKTGKLAAPVKAGDHLTGWRAGDIKTFLESLEPAPAGVQIQAAVMGAKKARTQAKSGPPAKTGAKKRNTPHAAAR